MKIEWPDLGGKKRCLDKQQIDFRINMSHLIFVFYMATLIEDTTGSIPKGSVVLPCDLPETLTGVW